MIKKILISSFVCSLLPFASALGETFTGITVNGNFAVQQNGTSNLTGTVHLGDGPADPINLNGTAVFDNSFTANGTNNKLPNQIPLTNSAATGATIVTRANGDARYAQISDLNGYVTTSQGNDYRLITDSYSRSDVYTKAETGTQIASAVVPYRLSADSYTKVETTNAIGTALTAYRTIGDSFSQGETNTAIANALATSLANYRTIETSFSKEQSDLRFFNDNDPQIIIGNHQVADPNAAIIVGNGVDAGNPSNSFLLKKDGTLKIGQVEIDPANNVVKVPQSGDIDMGGYQ